MNRTTRRDTSAKTAILDPLYGSLVLSPQISTLLRTPVLQRLRHVRLSNIDSTDLPGISGITRFEHVVGAASLVPHLHFAARLPAHDLLALQAAVLLHDSAITPFGHLIEEAYNYTATGFAHEHKWTQLSEHSNPSELGGADLQVYCGRRPGLDDWARRAFGDSAESRLRTILASINGQSQYGPLVAGSVDLDNIDNVSRIAYHMGIDVNRHLPVQLASSILECTANDGIVFADAALELVREWLDLRERVYTHLMLSPHDFAGKLMLIAATVEALRSGILVARDWTLSDWELLGKLTDGAAPTFIRDTTQRWLLGDLWDMSQLVWLKGKAPDYNTLGSFSEELSTALQRPCFAYRIKDKRTRQVDVRLQSGSIVQLGAASGLWLLGVGTGKRQAFTAADNQLIIRSAERSFGSSFSSVASSEETNTPQLF